jgi:hypothetical protein
VIFFPSERMPSAVVQAAVRSLEASAVRPPTLLLPSKSKKLLDASIALAGSQAGQGLSDAHVQFRPYSLRIDADLATQFLLPKLQLATLREDLALLRPIILSPGSVYFALVDGDQEEAAAVRSLDIPLQQLRRGHNLLVYVVVVHRAPLGELQRRILTRLSKRLPLFFPEVVGCGPLQLETGEGSTQIGAAVVRRCAAFTLLLSSLFRFMEPYFCAFARYASFKRARGRPPPFRAPTFISALCCKPAAHLEGAASCPLRS